MSNGNTKEIWKDIVGYEGFYQVSSLGRVRSCDRVVAFGKQKRLSKGRILVINTAGSNYNHIKLSKNNNIKRFYIHRLVAEAFIENKENKKEVNHLNENTRDNRVENLEWATKKENMRYSFTGAKNPTAKPMEYYEKKSIDYNGFKNICKRRNWNVSDFERIFDKYQITEKSKRKKYFFIFKGYKEEK